MRCSIVIVCLFLECLSLLSVTPGAGHPAPQHRRRPNRRRRPMKPCRGREAPTGRTLGFLDYSLLFADVTVNHNYNTIYNCGGQGGYGGNYGGGGGHGGGGHGGGGHGGGGGGGGDHGQGGQGSDGDGDGDNYEPEIIDNDEPANNRPNGGGGWFGNFFTSVFGQSPQTVASVVQESAVGALQDVGQSAVGALQNVGNTAISALEGAGQSGIGLLQDAGQSAVGALQGVGQSALDSFQENVQNLIKPVTEDSGDADYPEIIVNDKYSGHKYTVGGVHTSVGAPQQNLDHFRPQRLLRQLNEWAKPLFSWF